MKEEEQIMEYPLYQTKPISKLVSGLSTLVYLSKRTQFSPFSSENQRLFEKRTQIKPNQQATPVILARACPRESGEAGIQFLPNESKLEHHNHENTKQSQISAFSIEKQIIPIKQTQLFLHNLCNQ